MVTLTLKRFFQNTATNSYAFNSITL